MLQLSLMYAAPAYSLHDMAGLLIPVKNARFPALLRSTHRDRRLFSASIARRGVTRLSSHSVISRSKSTPSACKASSERDNAPVDTAAQNFLTVASEASPFKDVGATALTGLSNKGQEETLRAGHKLAEEGAQPTACHVLLHDCFLKSNGEGTYSLDLRFRQTQYNQPMHHGKICAAR